MNIDILICCQNYWDFIGYKQISGESSPVTIASRLGFVLSGPFENTKMFLILSLNLFVHI